AVAPAQAWKVEGAADFTGDGKADILWRNGTSNQVLLWTMDGGTVTSASTVEVNGAAAAPAQTWKVEGTADFTGDGKADILWRNGTSNQVLMWAMNGASAVSGANTGAVTYTGLGTANVSGLRVEGVADASGDGKADVLWRNPTSGQLTLWRLNGTAVASDTALQLNGAAATVSSAWSVQALADLTGDGKADVLWRNPTSGALTVWALDGNTVTSAASVQLNGANVAPGTAWQVEAVGDFTGDGKADLVWRNGTSNQVLLWAMNGATVTSSNAVQLNGAAVAPGAAWQVEGTGDFTGDGKADLVWRNTSSGQMLVWAMNGATVTSSNAVQLNGANVAPGTAWAVESVADLSGDGKADILWRNGGTGQLLLWEMNGSTVSASNVVQLNGAAATITAASGWTVAQARDFNGDGKADILWRNTATGQVSLWTMDGRTATSTGLVEQSNVAVSVEASSEVLGTQDYTGDGKADVLWRNTTTGQVSLWTM
ncbi:FG-GAP repeat domain-containing protein, partial [Azospirillum soli]|uniref:FG-GAP repeat domain-containing protein n=1 Tax=Azospirillum soli TaxID=1304799 RepID=UPI001AEB4B26